MQIKMTTMALAIASTLLTACGQSGVSGGVEQTAAQEVGSKADAGVSQTVQNGKSSRVSTEAAGAMAVANVAAELATLIGVDSDAYEENVKFHASPLLPVEAYLRARHAKGQSADAIKAQAEKDLARFAAVPATAVVQRYFADMLMVCAEAVAADPSAWVCYQDAYTASFTAIAVKANLTPREVPGLPGEIVDGLDKTRRFEPVPFREFTEAVDALTEVSIAFMPRWLTGVAGPMLRTADDQYLHIARQIMATDLAKARELATRKPVPGAFALPGDAGSPLRISVPAKGRILEQGKAGLVVHQHGSVFQGDGQLAGGKILLGIDSTAAANTEIRASSGTDSSTKITGSNKVGANIQ